jgi:hypothetical protein
MAAGHPSLRLPELDCSFESICETCTFFQTSIEFRPVLQAQHDHAVAHSQESRQQFFAQLLSVNGQGAVALAQLS